jgi:hypothetical protein
VPDTQITQEQLTAALLHWELQKRAGLTRTYEETDALPAQQVADESGEYLWGLLVHQPQVA